jgi:hypothetical protein
MKGEPHKEAVFGLFLAGCVITTHAFVAPYHNAFAARQVSWVNPTRLSSIASAISSNEELLPGIAVIDEQNHDFYLKVRELRHQPSFRLYSCDLLGSCEYLPQELFECYSESCEIYPVDDDEVSWCLGHGNLAVLIPY